MLPTGGSHPSLERSLPFRQALGNRASHVRGKGAPAEARGEDGAKRRPQPQRRRSRCLQLMRGRTSNLRVGTTVLRRVVSDSWCATQAVIDIPDRGVSVIGRLRGASQIQGAGIGTGCLVGVGAGSGRSSAVLAGAGGSQVAARATGRCSFAHNSEGGTSHSSRRLGSPVGKTRPQGARRRLASQAGMRLRQPNTLGSMNPQFPYARRVKRPKPACSCPGRRFVRYSRPGTKSSKTVHGTQRIFDVGI